MDAPGFNGCEAFDLRDGRPVDSLLKTDPAPDLALALLVMAADGISVSFVAGTEMARRGCETFVPAGTVERIWCDLVCEAFDPRAGKLVDCTIEIDTALDFSWLIVVKAVCGVLPGLTTSTEAFLEGGVVLRPIPAVKSFWPILILKTPSVVEFTGPLPTSKSSSFGPHCLTYIASLSMAVE